MTDDKNGQNQRDGNHRSPGLGGFKAQSSKSGDEQNEIAYFDSKRKNHNESIDSRRRRKVIGGILSQLIEDAKDQLAHCEKQANYYNSQIPKLVKKIDSLEGMKELYLNNQEEEEEERTTSNR